MQFPVEDGVSSREYTCQALYKLRGVKLAYYNIRGLINKKDEISILIKRSHLDLLILSESFLTARIDDSEIEVQGYRMFGHDRTANSNKSRGGGLVAYGACKRDFRFIEGSNYCDQNIEYFWLELVLKRTNLHCSLL